MKYISIVVLLLSSLVFSGFTTYNTQSAEKIKTKLTKRKEIRSLSKKTLNIFYKKNNKVRYQLQNSYGYAVFNNFGINLAVITSENGVGLAHNNRTGHDTFMKMVSGGLGVGLGIRNFKTIFLFKTKESYANFIEGSWAGDAQFDIAFKANGAGGGTNGAVSPSSDITIYKLVDNGLSIGLNYQEAKYSINEELN